MTWLVLGVALFSFGHMFRRLAPDARARLGNRGKGLLALVYLVGVVLMVVGFRGAPTVPLWQFDAWAVHLNNALMVVSILLVVAGNSKSRARSWMRHPMLTGVIVWAVAHLLVNGDLASLILFGGLGVWAAALMRLINRSEPQAPRFSGGTIQGDIRLVVTSALAFAAIAFLHIWLGVQPFGG